jgi:poly-gamma-glutamate synthesis protein (capsule biosynthesis protein)
MASPYPWHYTIQWPIHFLWPSTQNPTRIGRQPLSYSFTTTSFSEQIIRVLFLGDIMPMKQDLPPDLHPSLRSLLSNADLIVGNFESPVGESGTSSDSKHRFVFNVPQDYLQGIIKQVDLPPERWVFSMANNHAGDQGFDACIKTAKLMRELGVIPMGFWQPDCPPVIIVECEGVRLGLVAWTQWINMNVFRETPGIYRIEHILQASWKTIQRNYNIDMLVAFPHWEYEFQHFPRAKTRKLSKELADRGFSLIVGSHPHVLQPMEWIGDTLCQYSLGNFCSGHGIAWPVKLIPLLEIQICKKELMSKITEYKLHFFVQRHFEDHVALVPLEDSPKIFQQRVKQRLHLLFDTHNPHSAPQTGTYTA